ncbi:MAG: biotin--[acetyl-CoA-carboxylase] ligase [Verrucomicrobiales bacterium]
MNPLAEFPSIGSMLPDSMRLFVRDEVDSTNDEIRRLALAGADDGTVVVADRQTAGRGRRGAAWMCPPGEALAFSLLVRPKEPKALWPRLALASGLAVAEALESHGVECGIKWPNDVWVCGKKICGVLVEAGSDFAIIGIGVNVNVAGFPEELNTSATSLLLETGVPADRAGVLASILRQLEVRRHQIDCGYDLLLDAVRSRCVLTGHRISLLAVDGPRLGFCEGIGAGGELLVSGPNGFERLLQADEVRIQDTRS